MKRILLTGASGYVGGRLRRVLEERGHEVRCLARRPRNLRDFVPASTEIVRGDVLDLESLRTALAGVDTAFYLVHSLGSSGDFEAEERRGAENFGVAAREAGVRRIVYLGGLGPAGTELSPHLRSRHEVGRILADSGVPVIELRASIVIGSGSLSFEMIRALTERLPVMIAPRWVDVLAQPIAIDDLLTYLAESVEVVLEGNRVFEIGGADRVSYGDLIGEYARQRGLRRRLIRVPVLTPRLSSLWLGLVTPLYARVGRRLIESITHPTVVRDESARAVFGIEPRPVREAIALALRHEDREDAETDWSDSMAAAGTYRTWAGVCFGNRIADVRSRRVAVSPQQAFAPIRRIGGERGWYAHDWMWRLRGTIDLLLGGVGMRRGRRDPETLRAGEPLDFWRVERFEPGRFLRLAAEMKLPGRAWLEFEVEAEGDGAILHQRAIFDPIGLPGLAYWYLVYPLHRFVFGGMLREIAAAAEEAETTTYEVRCPDLR